MDDVVVLLRLQVEWGADEAIDLEPVDRLRAIRVNTPSRQHPVPVVAVAQGTANERALRLSDQANTLDDLRTAVAAFDGCVLRDTASNLVFAEGDTASATLIIGEPPGREEDRSGYPFAGPEGQLLDQMLASIGLSRTQLVLTSLLPWRPPGGRPPSAAEIAVCLPFLHRQIVLLKPRRIVLFGGTAARTLLPSTKNRRRGVKDWVGMSVPGIADMIPTMALPAVGELINNPVLKREAWKGLRMLRRSIDQI